LPDYFWRLYNLIVNVFYMKNSLNNIFLFLSFIIAMNCGSFGPRDSKTAQKVATNYFESIMFEDDINDTLFVGPILIDSSKNDFVFQWLSKVPKPGATIIEMPIPKDPNREHGYRTKGERNNYAYLQGTRDFPFNEAMIIALFGLPTSEDTRQQTRHLRAAPLNSARLEDLASFVVIKMNLREYASCITCRYPDSLADFNTFKNTGNCNVKSLDSLIIHDRYGKQYFYLNLINFVVLGSPGANDRWDFDKAIMDSIFNDQEEHINTTDDDIIVKIKPRKGCQ
jgi:hypothetical protein